MRYMAFILALLWVNTVQANERWTVYYGYELEANAFDAFDVVVLDGGYDKPVAELKAKGKTVLGYISFGEAENYRSFFKDIEAKGVLMEENPEWPGHIIIDVRKPEWKEYLIGTLIPSVLERGFDGVMFDTVDSPLHIGFKTPEEKRQMQHASIALLCAVHAAYPDITIMINRGFDILPDAAPCINKLLAESTHTDLQLSTVKKPRLLTDDEYGWYVKKMHASMKANPLLKIYTLDYWPQNDKEAIKGIFATQRKNGFIPYVSTMDLQNIYHEPK